MSDPSGTVIPSVPEPVREHHQVVVHRRAAIPAAIGLGAALLGALYLWRGVGSGGVLPWLVGGGLVLLAGYHLIEWIDARIPLLVADEVGIRLRLDDAWHGLIWADVADIDTKTGKGLFGDGHVAVRPVGTEPIEGVSARRRRLFARNTKKYGAPFVTVLGVGTVASTDDLTGALERLADGRAVVTAPDPEDTHEVDSSQEPDSTDPLPGPIPTPTPEPGPMPEPEPGPMPEPGPQPEPGPTPEPVPTPGPEPAPEPVLHSDIRVPPGEPHPKDRSEQHAGTGAPAVRALRMVRRALRAEVTRRPGGGAPVMGMLALDHRDAPSDEETKRAAAERAERARVRGNMSLVLTDPVETSAPEPEPEPAPEPELEPEPIELAVIGPQLAAARQRLGMPIDDLASRTRIRSHVIDAIEVDDFAPCGGDFYARGHLSSLSRVLGIDEAPLLELFEERYAQAPIDARKVFEAELATAGVGAIRGVGVGGPRWGALIAVVLLLLLVWGAVSYFAASEEPTDADAATLSVGSAGLTTPTQPQADVERRAVVRLVANGGDSRVVARTDEGEIVYRGMLLDGQTRWVRADEPLRVRVLDGGVVRARVNGEQRGVVGNPDQPTRIAVPARPVDRP